MYAYALALMERTPDLATHQPVRVAPRIRTIGRNSAARPQAASKAPCVRVIHGFVITFASEL